MISAYTWPGVSIEQWGIVAEDAAEVIPQQCYIVGLRVDQVDASASKANLDPLNPAPWAASPNTLYNNYYGTTATPRDEANVDAELYGIDLEGTWQWNERWRSDLNVAYVHAINTTDSRPVAQTPPLEGTVSLKYREAGWMFGGEVRAVAQQTRVDDDINTGSGLDAGQTPGFAVYNLYGHYQFAEQKTVSSVSITSPTRPMPST